MNNQFSCPVCQSVFTAEGETKLMLDNSSRLVSRCPVCQTECDMVEKANTPEHGIDDFMAELQKMYGGGCRGGRCNCN